MTACDEAPFMETGGIMTDRVQELVAHLVDIHKVPSLKERHARVAQARQLAFELPWSEAVLRVIETWPARPPPRMHAEHIAHHLELEVAHVEHVLAKLVEAGVIRKSSSGYRVIGTFSVDTRVKPEGVRQLRRHWLAALHQRSQTPHPTDWAGYNVMSISAKDLDFIRERLQSVYREIRTRVAASEPAEEVALVMLQLAHWTAPAQPSASTIRRRVPASMQRVSSHQHNRHSRT